ncbi:MAG: RNA polymerase sigma factor [Saprospiraceae bacterium]|nr:RNA polymerase sigma factor [Saprospiraceae bacterium]
MNEQDFLEILTGCRKRNRISQNALYRLYYSYAMSICIRYVEQEADAIAVVNQGFLKVFNNIKKFDEQKPFKPWFRRILVNAAINHIRMQEKFKQETNTLEDAGHVPSDEEIISKIGYQELMAMVQSLSTVYRTVFNMYVIDGYKHHEIAGILGITESTSKSNLTRARAKLRELVQLKLNNPYV